VRLSHQQKEILIALDTELLLNLKVVDPTEGKIQQGPEVLIASGFRGFKRLDEITQFGVEKCINGCIGLGSKNFGALEQIPIYGASEIDSSHAAPTSVLHRIKRNTGLSAGCPPSADDYRHCEIVEISFQQFAVGEAYIV
jgi:hypothetical protein